MIDLSRFDMEFRPEYFPKGYKPFAGRWVNLVEWTNPACWTDVPFYLQARKDGSRIRYRVWADTRFVGGHVSLEVKFPLRSTKSPLSMGELVVMMDAAEVHWCGCDHPDTRGLAYALHYEGEAMGSDLYPQLAEYYAEVSRSWRAPQWWIEENGEEDDSDKTWRVGEEEDEDDEDVSEEGNEEEDDGDPEPETNLRELPRPWHRTEMHEGEERGIPEIPSSDESSEPDLPKSVTPLPDIDWDTACCPDCGFPEVWRMTHAGPRPLLALSPLHRRRGGLGSCCLKTAPPRYTCLRCGFVWQRGEGLSPGVDVRNYRPPEEFTDQERERYKGSHIKGRDRRKSPSEEPPTVTLSELARIVRTTGLKITSVVVDDEDDGAPP